MPVFQNPRCYAAELGGCSKDISAEHFFSRGILELLDDGPGFNVSGFPWQQFGSVPQPSVASLTARILCIKHNSDLSPLDDECLKLFHFFEEADKKLGNKRFTGLGSYEVSGEALERWMLKALVGVLASGNAAKDDQRFLKSKPPLAWLQLLYGHEPMPERWGLYLSYELGERVMGTKQLTFAPLIHEIKVIGALCHIHGFRFLLAMTAPGEDRRGSLLESALYRPAHLAFSHKGRSCSVQLGFKWNGGNDGQGLEISYEDKKT